MAAMFETWGAGSQSGELGAVKSCPPLVGGDQGCLFKCFGPPHTLGTTEKKVTRERSNFEANPNISTKARALA